MSKGLEVERGQELAGPLLPALLRHAMQSTKEMQRFQGG